MRQKSKLEKERKEKKNVFWKMKNPFVRNCANGFFVSMEVIRVVGLEDSLQLLSHLCLNLLCFLTCYYSKVFSLVGIDDGTA